MSQGNLSWDDVDAVLIELVEFHKAELLKSGRRIVPHLTSDDVMQPNDFSELEYNPYFRYDEGVLAGVQAARTALSALKKSCLPYR